MNLTLRILSCLLISCTCAARAAERPNLLWISCEDISSHLGCYGDPDARTPHLNQLAADGVRYTHAFTCHGVCAPSRTGIITGMYPIALGANHMRSKVTLPSHVQCFPVYLRQAGYYCTNNSKTDYNFHWNQDEVWDETSGRAHWKNRPDKEQPFFAVFNLTMTHESRVWPENWKEVTKDLPADLFHDPATVKVPELYPDTPNVRAAIARLHDLITVMDSRLAELLAELDEAGLADNTIVVFWSDHGDGFPRAKRWIYDTGTLVPMIVRVPEQFRTSGQGAPGSVDEQLINLIDLGPTMLRLAGLPVPEHMHGRPFLGNDLTPPRDYIFGARDRIDDRFDMVRSARNRRFRYVRNYMPWLPALQFITYSERSVIRQELRRLFQAGGLRPELSRLFTVPRTAHELYDLENDPLEMHNLANDPDYQAERQRLQAACEHWQADVKDAHIMPESLLADEEASRPSRWHIFHEDGGAARWDAIFDVARREPGASGPQGPQSDEASCRWWQIATLPAGDASEANVAWLTQRLNDPADAVRIMAARRLYDHAESRAAALEVLAELLTSDSEFVRHAALLAVDELPGAAKQLGDNIRAMQLSNNYLERVAEHALGSP